MERTRPQYRGAASDLRWATLQGCRRTLAPAPAGPPPGLPRQQLRPAQTCGSPYFFLPCLVAAAVGAGCPSPPVASCWNGGTSRRLRAAMPCEEGKASTEALFPPHVRRSPSYLTALQMACAGVCMAVAQLSGKPLMS